MLSENLLNAFFCDNRILSVSFSGPSSSGKSTLIREVERDFQKLSIPVFQRASISRSHVGKKSEFERAQPEFQFMMLSEAEQADCQTFEKASRQLKAVILFDRTTLDGYLFFQSYLRQYAAHFETTPTAQLLQEYLERALRMTQKYTFCVLLQRVVCLSPSVIHTPHDIQFNNAFGPQFRKVADILGTARTIELGAIHGIADLKSAFYAQLAQHLHDMVSIA